MDAAFDLLNAADGALGDGDLGVTMARGMALVAKAAPELPDDLGQALLDCAGPSPNRRARHTAPCSAPG